MNSVKSILVAAPPDASASSFRSLLRNALTLKNWWKATLHVLVSSEQRDHAVQILGKNTNVIVHANRVHNAQSVLDTAKSYSCDLTGFTGKLSTDDFSSPARMLYEILEQSLTPVLVFPEAIDFRTLPIRSFLVPLSGEERKSEALALALRFAKQVDTPVDILHVAPLECPCPCSATLETVGDEIQHEYPELVRKIIAMASPYSDLEERKHVRYFWHASGLTSDEILRRSHQIPDCALIIEWKGTLEPGHADTLKSILRDFHLPVFFVRIKAEKKACLRVGKDFNAA